MVQIVRLFFGGVREGNRKQENVRCGISVRIRIIQEVVIPAGDHTHAITHSHIYIYIYIDFVPHHILHGSEISDAALISAEDLRARSQLVRVAESVPRHNFCKA